MLAEQNLVQVLDPQVIEEGGKEVQEICLLAASCVKLNAEDRPTMREVEHALEGILVLKKYVKNNVVVAKIDENGHAVKAHEVEEGSPQNLPTRAGKLLKSMSCSSKKEGESMQEWSRSYNNNNNNNIAFFPK